MFFFNSPSSKCPNNETLCLRDGFRIKIIQRRVLATANYPNKIQVGLGLEKLLDPVIALRSRPLS